MDGIHEAQIRWRCRRGLLELDLLLRAFVDQHFQHLSHDDQEAFGRLLELPDPILLDILVNGAEPPNLKSTASIVARIRGDSALRT